MRFMMLMIPSVYQGDDSPQEGFTPPAEAVAAMTRFNEELARAGALVSLDGLHPPSTGARVTFRAGKPIVTDGPFAEAKEVVGGYWIIQAASEEEAVDWAKRCPAADGDVIEIRRIYEMEDFPADARAAADSATVRTSVERRSRS